MMNQRKNRDLLKRYHPIVAVLQAAFAGRLRTIVLFGSQARGEARPNSDHDLLVVIEDLPGDPLARNRLVRSPLLPILPQLPGAISFVIRTPKEFESNLTPLLLDICSDGICLYGADYFEPYRRKALAALQQSGLRRETVGNVRMWLFPKPHTADWELSWDGFREGV